LIDDSDLVLNFNDMGILSGHPNGNAQGSRGGGARGGYHVIPGPSQHNHRGQFAPPNRGRGRGRGAYTPIPVIMGPPPATPPRVKAHQGGHPFFRGRGGGLGFILSPERPGPKNWDLATRPLLKPIKFVRAKERLFEADSEELLKAHKMPPLPSKLVSIIQGPSLILSQSTNWIRRRKHLRRHSRKAGKSRLSCPRTITLGKTLQFLVWRMR